jgi:glucose-6-phosphate 1-epimerase
MSIAPRSLGEFNGQPAVHLLSPDGDRAVVLLDGAHVVSWTPLGGGEQLYLSPNTAYGHGQAVRGGVPVVFPQFNTRGPLPKHGFARNRRWSLTESDSRAGHAFAVLRLEADETTRTIWPHDFACELTVSVGKKTLDLEFAVTNTGETAFDFMAALHTYLRVANVERAQLEGLMGQNYYDHVNGETRAQWVDVVTIAQELDRIYWRSPKALLLRELGRRLAIQQHDFNDTVVWNPGPIQSAKMADMADDGWLHMLCVEAARIGEPIRLAPGEEWAGMQSLTLQT